MTSKESLSNSIVLLIVMIAVFTFGVAIYAQIMDIQPVEYEGLFDNIFNGLDRWFESPVIVGWIATLIVAVGGWIENYTQTGEPFNAKKFAETFFYYEPVLILMSQAFPMPYALFVTFAIDVLRRIASRLRTPPTTAG